MHLFTVILTHVFKFHLICYLFCSQIVSFLTTGSLSKLDMTFWHVPNILWTLPSFLLQQHDLGSFSTFSAPILESAFHSGRPGSFSWGVVVRNQGLSTECPSSLLLESHCPRALSADRAGDCMSLSLPDASLHTPHRLPLCTDVILLYPI